MDETLGEAMGVKNEYHVDDSVRRFYDELWKDGYTAIASGKVDVDPFVEDPGNDHRRGLTLIVRPSKEVAESIACICARLASVASNIYYYATPQLHFTILSLVDATDAFDLDTTPVSQYERRVGEVLKDAIPFGVTFRGIAATAKGLVVQGYPMDLQLDVIRNQLRARCEEDGFGEGLDARYRIRAAHVTFGRFLRRNANWKLAAEIENLRDEPLGQMQTTTAELVVNDYFMMPGKVQKLAEFRLGH